MLKLYRGITKLYITVDSTILRWCLRPLLQNLDEPLKRDLISMDPLALMVFRDVNESLRRYAAMRHYNWFMMSFRKQPVAVREHSNFVHVRLFAFQFSLYTRGAHVINDILDNELSDDELLWCFRRLMPKAKKKLRSPRIVGPQSALFKRLMSTTQSDLDPTNECFEWSAFQTEKPIEFEYSSLDLPNSAQEWHLCLYSTILRYCLELMSQHKPKHSNHIQSIIKSTTLKCLNDPLAKPFSSYCAWDYNYKPFQRLVFYMQKRLPVDVLFSLHQLQGEWLSEECFRSDTSHEHRMKLMEVWMHYWSFTIGKPAQETKSYNASYCKPAQKTEAYNAYCATGGRPWEVPLIPYEIINKWHQCDTELPDKILKQIHRLFRYAMECLTLGLSTNDAFGDTAVFIQMYTSQYVKDSRLSGLSEHEQAMLEKYLATI